MAGGDCHVGQRRAHRIGHRAFVGRIGVGMQQTDRNALHALLAQHVDCGSKAHHIERHGNRAVGAQLLDHLQPQPSLDQRARLGPVQVVQYRHAKVTNLQDVAKTLGGDQCGACALSLQDRVGPDRRAMQHVRHRPPVGRQQRAQTIENSLAVIVRRGGDLVRDHAPVCRDRNEVGERAADVDADALSHSSDRVSVSLVSGLCRADQARSSAIRMHCARSPRRYGFSSSGTSGRSLPGRCTLA